MTIFVRTCIFTESIRVISVGDDLYLDCQRRKLLVFGLSELKMILCRAVSVEDDLPLGCQRRRWLILWVISVEDDSPLGSLRRILLICWLSASKMTYF